MIYGHVTNDECKISVLPMPDLRPECTLSGTIYPAMLLLNHQIQDEYLNHTLHRSELVISYEYAANLSVGWVFEPNIPIEVFKGIRLCRLQVRWLDVLYYDCRKVSEFCDRMEVELVQDQESLSWTPSKGIPKQSQNTASLMKSTDHLAEMSVRLKAILSKLHRLLSESTKIAIDISIAGLPDPNDLNMIGLCPIPYNEWEPAKHLSRMFHPTTLSRLSNDATVPWSKAGNLTVTFSMRTPLHCTAADREREEILSRADHNFVDRYEEIRLGCFDDGRPIVTWELELTTGEDCYRGFFPKVKEIDGNAGER